MANILVIGSMNMDIVTQVDRHPIPGETVQGQGTRFYAGGKGANQAVAAARSGASVNMGGVWATISSAMKSAIDWPKRGSV
ncbi:PfkB family carbohydrate kinase [Paenibacillus sp. M1]|uniref:PfkB family carbohydrate kinase n=1 Tax=Paenibacillus haidiansis TaxID=1574488 RepID=A0ABU7VUQ0_9BACL